MHESQWNRNVTYMGMPPPLIMMPLYGGCWHVGGWSKSKIELFELKFELTKSAGIKIWTKKGTMLNISVFVCYCTTRASNSKLKTHGIGVYVLRKNKNTCFHIKVLGWEGCLETPPNYFLNLEKKQLLNLRPDLPHTWPFPGDWRSQNWNLRHEKKWCRHINLIHFKL